MNRQPAMVQMVQRLIVHMPEARKRSISIIRRGASKAQKHPNGLCVLSSTLLPVYGYSMREEEFTPPLNYHGLRQWRG